MEDLWFLNQIFSSVVVEPTNPRRLHSSVKCRFLVLGPHALLCPKYEEKRLAYYV